MATKKTNKKAVKTNVNKSGKSRGNSTSFFKWWMAVLLVVIVALVGIIAVRFSEAATTRGSGAWQARVVNFDEEKLPFDSDRDNIVLDDTSNGQRYHFWYDNKRGGRVKLWWSFGSGRCVSMTKGEFLGGMFKSTLEGRLNFQPGDIITVWEQNPAECYERSTKSLQSG